MSTSPDRLADVRAREILALQRLERRLVRAQVAAPEEIDPAHMRRLRYLLALARLDEFEPGGGLGSPSGRFVSLGPVGDGFRRRVGHAIGDVLAGAHHPSRLLRAAEEAAFGVVDLAVGHHALICATHDLTPAEIDVEIGRRGLTLVLGGGGAAAYSYLGAFRALVEAERLPDYIVGSSVGAVMGALLAREVPVPVDDYLTFAADMTYRGVIGPASRPRRHGVRAPLSLRLDEAMEGFLRTPNGMPMRLRDTAIPLDVVATGLQGHAARAIPRTVLHSVSELARRHRSGPVRASGSARAVLLGADEVSRELNVLDAISFSSAIPGLLHHETTDPDSARVLDEVMACHRVDALVDGSTVSNVPAEQAWNAVRAGRIGRRDTAVLALDCFYPQARLRQAWYAPVAGLVTAQWNYNRPFCDVVLRMPITLAPSSLAPGRDAVERAATEGAVAMRAALPFIEALTAPTSWADVAA